MRIFIVLCGLLFFSACSTESSSTSADTDSARATARVPDSWIHERVAATRATLSASEAGRLVWQAMEAHGGLERWFSNGPIEFAFDYVPRGEGVRRHTVQQVNQWNNTARHQEVGAPQAEYGWDGEHAWMTTADTARWAYNTRFWATTPYFFLGQPFVLAGGGARLEKLPPKTLNGRTYDAVKVTFAPGTGDAPDDYYIAYFDQETHRQTVIRYIVSYPGYFEKGKHLPEKLMTLHDYTTVDGIVLPTAYKTHWLAANEQPGEHITDIRVGQIRFRPELEKTHFELPANSTVMQGL